MADRDYTIQHPDGRELTISGPDNATAEQLRGAAERAFSGGAGAKPQTQQTQRPAAPESPYAGMQTAGRVVRDTMAGVVRGAGSIGATLLAPVDAAARAAGVENSFIGRTDRRAAMDAGLSDLGADTKSMAYDAGKVGGEVAGTMGMGGALANGIVRIAPGVAIAAPGVLNSIRTMGMEAGPFAQGFARKAATRAFGGALGGGASTLAVEGPDAPGSVAAGAAIGVVAPGVIGLMGKLGIGIGSMARNMRDGGGSAGLRNALGMTDAELQQLAVYARSAPDELVPGSKLTLAQALQYAMPNGAPPQVKMLDRVVAGGPGGAALAARVPEQNAARIGALQRQGAQVYPGAAAIEADATGNRLGAMLRTQYEDASTAMRQRGEALQGRAKTEGVRYQVPELQMAEATKPMGAGYVGDRAKVEALMNEASNLRNNAMGGGVPFEEFQRLRQSAGDAAAALAAKEGNGVQAGVANKMRLALQERADNAAAGNTLRGENVPRGFAANYQTNRGLDRKFFTDYESTDNIGAILKKPFGGQYTKDGNEVLAKIWHGGQGLVEDVARFRDVLSPTNQGPGMKALQEYVLTEAAGRTTAGGMLSAQFVKDADRRAPGLRQALTSAQLKEFDAVVSDVRNAMQASDLPAVKGSDTQAKIANALNAGLLDSPALKGLARVLSFKGLSAEPLRAKFANMTVAYKGKVLAELLADPKLAAEALQAPKFVGGLPPGAKRQLEAAARVLPVLAVGSSGDR